MIVDEWTTAACGSGCMYSSRGWWIVKTNCPIRTHSNMVPEADREYMTKRKWWDYGPVEGHRPQHKQ
jgi:hypothetical protein